MLSIEKVGPRGSWGPMAPVLPVRPASAGSPWRNPGRLRLRDIDRLRTSARKSRPSSAPSQASRVVLAEAPSAIEILSQVYAERAECGLMQYRMKFGVKAPKAEDKDENVETCCSAHGSIVDHMATMRNDVYLAGCDELRVKANSGVMAWFAGTARCICQQDGCNLRNMLLGNRGILGVLPLFDSMKSLKSLSLVGNSLRDAGTKALLNSLTSKEQLPQLSVFDMSQNPLSASSGDELEPLLATRKLLVLVGLAGTNIGSRQRQRLLQQSLSNFENAQAGAALEAWRLAISTGFADTDLRASCVAHAEVLGALPGAASDIDVALPPQRPPGPAPRACRKAAAFVPAKPTTRLCAPDCTLENCNVCR